MRVLLLSEDKQQEHTFTSVSETAELVRNTFNIYTDLVTAIGQLFRTLA